MGNNDALVPQCGVHYLWFAFVCFLMRSHRPQPPTCPPTVPDYRPIMGSDMTREYWDLGHEMQAVAFGIRDAGHWFIGLARALDLTTEAATWTRGLGEGPGERAVSLSQAC